VTGEQDGLHRADLRLCARRRQRYAGNAAVPHSHRRHRLPGHETAATQAVAVERVSHVRRQAPMQRRAVRGDRGGRRARFGRARRAAVGATVRTV